MKTTVEQEFEYWNVILVMKKLTDYFRYKLRGTVLKNMQGLEASDFAMGVIEKICSGQFSWQKSKCQSFIDWCYACADSEANHFNRDNKERHFESVGYNRELESESRDYFSGAF
jgi:hypothetical protein